MRREIIGGLVVSNEVIGDEEDTYHIYNSDSFGNCWMEVIVLILGIWDREYVGGMGYIYLLVTGGINIESIIS